MKTSKIIFLLTSLVLSIFTGNAFAYGIDAQVVVGSVNIMPHIMTGVVFTASMITQAPIGSLMMGYVNVDVSKPSGIGNGSGGNVKSKITFFDFDDVLVMPSRDAKGVVITDNIIFKQNAYMITVYGTQDTIKNNTDSSGEIDAEGIMQSVGFSHPGNKVEVREFRSNWLGRNIGIIEEHCSDNTKDLYGSPCAPLRMEFKHETNKDKNATEFTLKSATKGPDVADYQGTLTYDSVTGTIAADDTTPDVAAGEGRYQLTDGSVAAVTLTTLDNAVHGQKYTLLGSGGDYPSIITNANDFVLKDGTQWTALAGSQITFEAVKSGANSFVFVERSRA